MSWPTVQINQVNQLQGETNEIERVVLFIGMGNGKESATGQAMPVNTQSDFDALLGTEDTVLKSTVKAAMSNAGQNWSGFICTLPKDLTAANTDKVWPEVVMTAQQVASVEGVVLVLDASKATIEAAASLRSELISRYGRWVWFILAVSAPAKDEDWTKYLARLSVLQNGAAAPSVQLVPCLWGNEPGVLAGRLCNRAVTIADSPARVQTGALLDMGSTDLPVDGIGSALTLATLQALEAQRFSVPMWYPDYDGYYWSDGRTLDVEGGDYQAIENLRIVDKVARRVRLQAIAKIADRGLNSTPGSIATHQAYFAKTLREMSRSSQINGVTFPGEAKPPQDGDVSITWLSKSKVEIYITVRTYECPKGITVSLVLDQSLESE